MWKDLKYKVDPEVGKHISRIHFFSKLTPVHIIAFIYLLIPVINSLNVVKAL